MRMAISLVELIRPQVALEGLFNLLFFKEVNDFLRDEIGEFQDRLIGDMMSFLGAMALVLLTVWILWQGFRIVTGRSRDSMMALVVDSLRATLVIAAATGFAMANSTVYESVTDGLGNAIVSVISGEDYDADDLYGDIDKSLAVMNLAMGSIENVQALDGSAEQGARERNMLFAGFGTAGPAIIAGAMLTLNKIAIALFVGLGPLFILCLLFDATKSLFQRWLLYGIGTMFSLAVLYVMATLAMDLTLAVAGSYWASGLLFQGLGDQGLNNMALQQGGLGVILTMLLITAPMMAANFFQGTLGNFMHYSAFGGSAASAPSVYGPAGAPAMPTNQAVGRESVTTQSSSFDQGYSPNAGTRVTGPGAGSATAQEDQIKQKGLVRPSA